jgi:hypothetical protein
LFGNNCIVVVLGFALEDRKSEHIEPVPFVSANWRVHRQDDWMRTTESIPNENWRLHYAQQCELRENAKATVKKNSSFVHNLPLVGVGNAKGVCKHKGCVEVNNTIKAVFLNDPSEKIRNKK